MNRLRLAFMGTPDFAVSALRAIHAAGHDVVCIYTQPPRPKGRGQQLQKSAAHIYGDAHGIEVRTPAHFKNEDDVNAFRGLNLDVAVVAAYGMLLPQDILDAPKHGCINIHPSLLPRWRGTSPVQFAIWKGDAETGVSIMKLVHKMDAGPVIKIEKIPLPKTMTHEMLNQKLWALGSKLVVGALDELSRTDELPLHDQNDLDATYTKMLSREDGRIDWGQEAAAIDRQIRALNPWPGVWTMLDNRRIKILEAAIADYSSDQAPGYIINKQGDTCCGNNTILRLIKIQPENAKPMHFSAAMNGTHLKEGDLFS